MIIEIDHKFKLGQSVDIDNFIQKIENTYKKFMTGIKNIIKKIHQLNLVAIIFSHVQ